MDGLFLFSLAVGLAMDAFAVSVCNGICYGRSARGQSLYMAGSFGVFQGGMTLLGFLAGITFSHHIVRVDHWVALILLGVIGGKMIYEALHEEEALTARNGRMTVQMLLAQSVATSIDALAIGVGLAVIRVDIVAASLLIAVVTFLLCAVGYRLGNQFGQLLSKRATIFGGAILILLGVKIFLEHMHHCV